MIRFNKYPEKNIKQMAAEAMGELIADVPVDKKDIEAAWFSNAGWGIYDGQHCIRGQVALAPMGIQGIPITNVENACAGGATALHAAWTAVKAGLYDLVLAIGAEKVFTATERQKMFDGFLSGTDVEFSRAMIEIFQADAKKQAAEAGEGGEEKGGGHAGVMHI